MATPCRVRRKLFDKAADSQITLVAGKSTESLNSVDKAALDRKRTVDLTPTPPVTRIRSKSSQSLGSTGGSEKQPEKTPESGKETPSPKVASPPKGKTAKEKAEDRAVPKAKASSASQRVRAHLEEAKQKRLKNEKGDGQFKRLRRMGGNEELTNSSPESTTKKSKQTGKNKTRKEGKIKIKINKTKPNEKDSITPSKSPRRTKKETPTKESTKDQENKKDENNECTKTDAKTKKVHAMYMKYWRSLKSI